MREITEMLRSPDTAISVLWYIAVLTNLKHPIPVKNEAVRSRACVSRTSSTWLGSPTRQMSEALGKFRSLLQQLLIALPTTDFASAPSGFLKHRTAISGLW
ncbi:hypothetical protein J6590_076470 [Homalodisca vitripennis]|nr:hypothetical protein J6590_076470 [Homalodisca vitripennis]